MLGLKVKHRITLHFFEPVGFGLAVLAGALGRVGFWFLVVLGLDPAHGDQASVWVLGSGLGISDKLAL